MGEFWAGTNGQASVKLASSVGHIYGQNIIGTESFTGYPEHGRWTDDPYSLKALGDLAFTQGINRFIFHRFAHQPWMNRYPGMTMGQWGINLDRTNTWFEKAKPWMDYISRSQFLLQQGRFVADAAYFCGESSPVVTRIGNPPLPAGFDYDSINRDVILKSSVKDGRLLLPDGMSYAVLVLPPNDPAITPELLKKIHDLVADGLTVVGEKPKHSPSLNDYPKCDDEVSALANEMWADCDGSKVTEHALGQGKVVWGKPLADVFAGLKIAADFDAPENVLYIHRAVDGGDVYFVANHENSYQSINCTFRVSGKVPELWHPDTGVIETAPVYEEKEGRTTIRLQFDPVGSVFVVFRQRSAGVEHLTQIDRTATTVESSTDHDSPAQLMRVAGDGSVEILPLKAGSYQLANSSGKSTRLENLNGLNRTMITGPWELRFPPNWGAPPSVSLDNLISWSDSLDSGIKYFSGTATYTKSLDISDEMIADHQAIYLDLGTVKNFAEVTLNGKDLGILWKPPFQLDITSNVRPGKNDLQIGVTNLWPNRIIGDAQLPEDVEWQGMKPARWPQWMLDGKPSPTGRYTFTTWRHWTKDGKLLESGLIGPVTIESGKWMRVQ